METIGHQIPKQTLYFKPHLSQLKMELHVIQLKGLDESVDLYNSNK